MNSDRFKELLDELDGNSLQTLKEKNARYSKDGDCLHNFRSGADITGGTPAQACWGYVTKHLVALRDMVQKNDFSNREDFLEKCQDTINYVRFLWCIGNDKPETKETISTKYLKESECGRICCYSTEQVRMIYNKILDIANKNGYVSVGDIEYLVCVPSSLEHNLIGWMLSDIKNINLDEHVIRDNDMYVLELPKYKQIN